MKNINLKKQLHQICSEFVENRAETVGEIIASNQKALQSETKSSAGDKHETGRAIVQLEMEKASQQLASIDLMKEVLSKINPEKNSSIVQLGSVVMTTLGNYFLSIGMGKIELKNTIYHAVSTSSPIGRVLLGLKVGESSVFNEKEMEVLAIF
jgi:transcription elongation GreA/GreB family factor